MFETCGVIVTRCGAIKRHIKCTVRMKLLLSCSTDLTCSKENKKDRVEGNGGGLCCFLWEDEVKRSLKFPSGGFWIFWIEEVGLLGL